MSRRLLIAVAGAAASLLLVAPAAAQADWGAISINEQTGHAAISYDYATAPGAKVRAQAECGSGCHVAAWVHNGFAVLVKTPGGRFIAGLGKTRDGAYLIARRRAHDYTAPLYVWVYSG